MYLSFFFFVKISIYLPAPFPEYTRKEVLPSLLNSSVLREFLRMSMLYCYKSKAFKKFLEEKFLCSLAGTSHPSILLPGVAHRPPWEGCVVPHWFSPGH